MPERGGPGETRGNIVLSEKLPIREGAGQDKPQVSGDNRKTVRTRWGESLAED